MAKKKNYQPLYLIFSLLVGGYLVLLVFGEPPKKTSTTETPSNLSRTEQNAIERTEINYGDAIDKYATQMNLPSAYFKALVVLECSGKKHFQPRFEKHVFEQLKAVRDGQKKHYYNIKKRHIPNIPDAGLKNLATSWGPFQIMGYQVLTMNIKVRDIRGDNSVYWGMEWIRKRYGKYLKKEKFKDAFHIHNAGSPYPRNGSPRTYHPDYCDNGLKYMAAFGAEQ